MCGTFETGRQGLDASLESALEAHRDLVTSAHPNGGVGADPFITIGKIGGAADRLGDNLSADCANLRDGGGRNNTFTPLNTTGAARESTHCATSKLELGTWSERLVELFDEIADSQSFCTVREKVQGIREGRHLFLL